MVEEVTVAGWYDSAWVFGQLSSRRQMKRGYLVVPDGDQIKFLLMSWNFLIASLWARPVCSGLCSSGW